MKKFLLLVLLSLIPFAGFAQTISKCGYTIETPGVYTVTAPLTAAEGLTHNDACIEIEAPHVILLTNGNSITGNGAGVGILVDCGARDAFVSAAGKNLTYTVLQGWQYGVKSRAENLLIEAFYYYGNQTGILLQDAKRNTISLPGAANNSEYGIRIQGGRANRVEVGGSWGNGVAGVSIEDGSRDNYVFEILGYAGAQKYGIYVERGSTGNRIVDNDQTVSHTDLYDGNDAGDNFWRENYFKTANKGFIQ